MNEDDTIKLKKQLMNVREGYRYIFEYQKHILGLISFIGKKYGFSYKGGYPKFSNNTPRTGFGSLDNWSWDWLNFYLYEFHFSDKEIDDDILSFSIVHQADNGKWITDAEETQIDQYENSDKSKTQLIFIIGKNGWDDIVGIDTIIDQLSIKESKIASEDNRIIIAKAYNLEEFINEDNTNNIINDFLMICSDKGVKIK